MENQTYLSRIKKLFGGIDLTWKKLIIFAVIAGVYTGVMALLPFVKDTSFADISITFEWWVLFGIIIIMNSKSPLDSGLKCIVFFLISQPLVYLVQVPFFSRGWEIFGYYKGWFIWTLFTFPMGFIGYFLKKNKWWGLFILVPMMAFVGYHFAGFLGEAITWFPHHLLSAVFCAATVLLYPAVVFDDRKIRRIGLILGAVILAAAVVIAVRSDHVFYNTTVLLSDESGEKYFDDTYTVSLADESYGKVYIAYEESIECYSVRAEFNKPGKTELIVASPDGKEIVYEITIEKNSYHLERKGSGE